MKKNTKLVKGVEEPIFMKKFNQLYSYLNSIDNDDLILFSGKKKAQYFKIDRKTKRRSGFRGVSRNGASWQVLMMINNVKTYIGWYDTEEEGALVYDIVSILFKLRKARTNLSYSKSKLLTLLSYYDHDSKHFKGFIPPIKIEAINLFTFSFIMSTKRIQLKDGSTYCITSPPEKSIRFEDSFAFTNNNSGKKQRKFS